MLVYGESPIMGIETFSSASASAEMNSGSYLTNSCAF